MFWSMSMTLVCSALLTTKWSMFSNPSAVVKRCRLKFVVATRCLSILTIRIPRSLWRMLLTLQVNYTQKWIKNLKNLIFLIFITPSSFFLDILTEEPSLYMDLDRSSLRQNERFDFLDSSFLPVHAVQNGDNLPSNASVNSMPDLCISDNLNSISTVKRPNSTDILLNDSVDHSSQ